MADFRGFQSFGPAAARSAALDVNSRQFGADQARRTSEFNQTLEQKRQVELTKLQDANRQMLGQIGDRLAKIREAGGDPEQALGLLRRPIMSMAAILGVTPDQIEDQLRAFALAGQNPAQAAALAGQKTAATQAETVRSVTSRTPEGNQRTQLFRGTSPVATVGEGPTVIHQPQTLPGAKPSDVTDLDNAEIGVRNAIGGVIELKKLVKEGGEAALAAGSLAEGIQNLRSATIGFAQLAGVDTSKFEDGTGTLNADQKAETVFERLGIAATLSSQIKSDIVNLAFAAAAASGQTGRGVSDKDFERFVRELGVGAKRPETFNKVLDRFAARLNRNFQNRFRVQARRIPSLDPANPPDIMKELGFGQEVPTQAAVPEGFEFVETRDGKTIIRRQSDGQLFKQD